MSFKIGNAVKLKGGGPTMTVTGTSTGPDRDVLYSCTWFDKDNKEQLSSYPAAALMSAEKKPKISEPSGGTSGKPHSGGGTGWMT